MVTKSSYGKGANKMRINVDPAKLELCATRIEQQVCTYEKHYHQLFQEVERMQAGWRGKDNVAFVTQINTFQSDFQQMSTLMKEYANFLKMSSKMYRQTQDERMNQARHLGV